MADLNTIGMRVDARMAVITADSNDAGENPDKRSAVAKVTFTSTLAGPTTYLPDSTIVAVSKVVCELDSNGQLRPPEDGVGSAIVENGNVILVSPQDPGLLDQGWSWTARFVPTFEQGWNAFTITGITGAPGETVVITTALPTTPSGTVRQALVYLVDDRDDLPAGVEVGDLILEVPTMTLGRAGA